METASKRITKDNCRFWLADRSNLSNDPLREIPRARTAPESAVCTSSASWVAVQATENEGLSSAPKTHPYAFLSLST